ncbi:hypothetical protein AVEN_152151-2-1, partial [Araneus ventricosus]
TVRRNTANATDDEIYGVKTNWFRFSKIKMEGDISE